MDWEAVLLELDRHEKKLERLETLEFAGNNLLVQDEGVTLPGERFEEMNFTGAGVAATVDPGNPLKAVVTALSAGSKGSVEGCYLSGYERVGTSTYWEMDWNTEIWDPDDMFDAGSDPNRVQIISEGYWLVLLNAYAVFQVTTLRNDRDKIAMTGGDILIYDGFGIDDEWDFEGGAAFCLSSTTSGDAFNSYVSEVSLTMFGIYRHDGTNSDPWVGAEYFVTRDPNGGWNSLPNLNDLYVWIWVQKMGDLEA